MLILPSCEAQVKAQERLCTKLQEGLDALHAAVKLARRRRDPAVHNLEINLQYHTDEFGAQTKELKLVKAKHFFEEEEVKRLQRLEKKVQGSLGEHRAMLERKKLEREGRKQLKETVAATKIQVNPFLCMYPPRRDYTFSAQPRPWIYLARLTLPLRIMQSI